MANFSPIPWRRFVAALNSCRALPLTPLIIGATASVLVASLIIFLGITSIEGDQRAGATARPSPPFVHVPIPPVPSKAAGVETPPPIEVAKTIAPTEPAAEPPAIQEEVPPWQRFAVAVAANQGAMIAIVIDDLGNNPRAVQSANALPGPLTLAFLPYFDDLPAMTSAARRAGHELLVHLPMEPEGPDKDPGPRALTTGISRDELLQTLNWHLTQFGGYVGVNNHMGSRFTRDPTGMEIVLGELHDRGLLYLDSRTTHETVGFKIAKKLGMPTTERDVFIDNVADHQHIVARLSELEQVAIEQGFAVGIGHPNTATIEVLAAWLPGLESQGFALVPISAIIAHTMPEPSLPAPDLAAK